MASQAEKLVATLQELSVYQVIDKFLEHEQDYATQLRVLNDLEVRLRAHFDAEDHILLIEDIDAVFISSGSLYNFTQGLVQSLNKKRWDGPEQFLLEVGDMLVKNMQFFKMYGQYTQNLKSATDRLAVLLERDTKFKRWLDFNEGVAGIRNKGGTASLLKLPQQHFPTYSVFLEAIVKSLAKLDANHPATESVNNALAKFLDVLDNISTASENTTRINRVVDIQKLYFKDNVILVEASRKWYRTSKIKIKDVKENKKQVDAILFLFNDCVAYATSAFFGGYNLTGIMSIAGLQIQPLQSVSHTFKLTCDLMPNREWEITCITNETPDQRRLEGKETAERSYYSWIGALLKVYKLYYNISEGGSRTQHSGVVAPLATRCTHPEDMLAMMNRKNVPSPRQVDKPSPHSQSAAQSDFDRLQSARAAQGNAGPAFPSTQQSFNTVTQMPPSQQFSSSSHAPSHPPIPETPRRAPVAQPVGPPVKALTDDEIRESIVGGTKLNDWEKVLDESSGQYYYENVPLQSTTWEEPEEFVAHFNQLRSENDAAVAAYKAAAAAGATPAATPAAAPAAASPGFPRPPTGPPQTPGGSVLPGPPSMGPSSPAGPPGMPPQGMPPAGPPSGPPQGMPPAGPPSGAPSGPPSGPPGMPGGGRGGLLSAIQGGANLRHAEAAPAPAAVGGPPRGGLLGAIQGGIQLKKADVEEKEAAPAPPANNLMAALANYRKFVQDDEENEEGDDDDWD